MTDRDILWKHDEAINSLPDGPDVPEWIDQYISPATVAAIVQGGCDSGAYMPAVTYWQALETMNEHGDAIFDYLETTGGEEPCKLAGLTFCHSWAELACFFVSWAVEAWASSVKDELVEVLGWAE